MTITAATPPDPLAGLAALLNEAFNVGAQIADDGALHLRMDGDLVVSVAASPDGRDLVFTALLVDLTRGRTVATLMAALALNLYQEATRGGALALDSGSQTVVFSWRLPVESVPATDWVIALENFCATAESLRAGLEDAVGEFNDEELQAMDQRAAGDAALSESGPLAAPEPVSVSTTHFIRG